MCYSCFTSLLNKGVVVAEEQIYFDRKLYDMSIVMCTSMGLWSRSCSSAFSRAANACVISSRASSFGAAASSAES